jgi:hypothetical protein
LVIQKLKPLDSDSSFVKTEIILVIEEVSLRLEEFPAVKIPREALVASTVMKFLQRASEEGY